MQTHPAFAIAERTEVDLGSFNLRRALPSDLDTRGQATGKTGRRWFIPSGQSPLDGQEPHICLGKAGFLQRMADGVFGRGGQSWPIIALVVQVRAAAD